MLLSKISTENADKLAKTLSPISSDAETSGYLVGLLQDTRRCVEANLSVILTTDIRKGTDK